jgi:hypothetical protein
MKQKYRVTKTVISSGNGVVTFSVTELSFQVSLQIVIFKENQR